MSHEPSKFALNPFDSITEGRNPLMSEMLITTIPKVTASAILHPALAPAVTAINAISASWSTAETALANAEAAQLGATMLCTEKLASVNRKPDTETNSIIEGWDMMIRSSIPYQGSVYTSLLPQGRETITTGTIDNQIDAIRAFGVRLAAQPPSRPTLIALGATVTAFAIAARSLRTTQLNAKTNVDNARVAQENVRLAAAAELYSMIGLGMGVFKMNPEQVDSLFDVALLRGGQQSIPGAPGDMLWVPASRTLSTTVLPAGATRIEAWRQAPGSVLELAAVGELGALSVEIPAGIVFTVGESYQLWLQARNSRGSSSPGPVENWTAE